MMFKKHMAWMVGTLFVCGSLLTGCGVKADVKTAPAKPVVKLDEGHWNPAVKAKLETLIAEGAFQGKKAVFDFDNTTICRDIGEATFAAMVEAGQLTLDGISRDITPSFVLGDKKVSLETVKNLPEFYEDFLSATKHQKGEKTPYSNSYAWVVQILAGMTPDQILPYSEKAFGNNVAKQDSGAADLKETKINGYRMPFFYPEMVDLYGNLLKNGYEVYVCSASNVWTVRWMVAANLNKLLEAKFGKGVAIAPDHVIGVNVLLKDKRDGKLYKDRLLVKNNPKYAALDREELSNYELTTQVVYPITGYFGKVANIIKYVTKERPYLIGGDSSNDLPMLDRAENRLWITRLEKMGYQKGLVEQMGDSLPGNWMIQPVLYKKSPGFVSTRGDLDARLAPKPSAIEKTAKVAGFLEENGALKAF
ncbi:HAD family hydrolase [Desulfoluna butyratoxydans]|uniref:Had-like domain n=1 Tax=Desulfoluna butyratoxydans TaxID=231438 RepID=A0A4U8YNK7_9BACT|nr:HAD family hydrolase [Desulfoluna butyratoxydans]VFQ45037.1 had-like domain [Desulfoluna butyratoxydans]